MFRRNYWIQILILYIKKSTPYWPNFDNQNDGDDR